MIQITMLLMNCQMHIIGKYDKILGDSFILVPNTGDNKNIATKATFKRRVIDTLGNPGGRVYTNPLPYIRE